MNKKFDITIDGVNFKSNEGGLLNLNEVARAFNLKSPSQWRNKDSAYLIANAKLHSLSTRASGGAKVNYWAGDEDTVILYAQYISIEFTLKVIHAFKELRRGNLLAAAKIADTTQLESKAFSAWLEMEDSTIQQTLKMLGIVRPNFFQKKIKQSKQRDSLVERGILKQRNYGKHGTALRMTAKGKGYLMGNLASINTKIEKLYQAEKDMVV
tara:strand:- start:140 stop:772 length:633 start_codon:yes stop_codon:yes gene_type:complete